MGLRSRISTAIVTQGGGAGPAGAPLAGGAGTGGSAVAAVVALLGVGVTPLGRVVFALLAVGMVVGLLAVDARVFGWPIAPAGEEPYAWPPDTEPTRCRGGRRAY